MLCAHVGDEMRHFFGGLNEASRHEGLFAGVLLGDVFPVQFDGLAGDDLQVDHSRDGAGPGEADVDGAVFHGDGVGVKVW